MRAKVWCLIISAMILLFDQQVRQRLFAVFILLRLLRRVF